MRIWFDTEFHDTGRTIELISIGMVSEDGHELYAEVLPPELVVSLSPWLARNVAPNMRGGSAMLTRREAAREILLFAGAKPEFWAYVASYDWVCLSQLYGTLMDRPKGWPMSVMDADNLKNFGAYEVKAERAHNALSDAKALKATWERYAYHNPVFEMAPWQPILP